MNVGGLLSPSIGGANAASYPAVLNSKELTIEVNYSIIKVYCPTDLLEEKPLKVLHQLAQALKENPNVYTIEAFYVEPTGVTRKCDDIISDLTKTYEVKLLVSSPLFWIESDHQAFTDIGIIFGFLIHNCSHGVKNHDYKLGISLQTSVYSGLLSFEYEELGYPFNALSKERISEIAIFAENDDNQKEHLLKVYRFIRNMLNPAEITDLFTELKRLNFVFPDSTFNEGGTYNIETFPAIRKQLVDTIFEVYQQSIHAYHAIASSMIKANGEVTERLWNEWTYEGAKELQRRIESPEEV